MDETVQNKFPIKNTNSDDSTKFLRTNKKKGEPTKITPTNNTKQKTKIPQQTPPNTTTKTTKAHTTYTQRKRQRTPKRNKPR